MQQFSKYRVSREELSKTKDYCMLIRDTMLSDIQHIKNVKESGIIYSIWSGYKKLQRTKKVLDYAQSKGIKVVYLHTSGHACIKSLHSMIKDSQPQKIIPVHTENPEMFKERFRKVHIIKDGERISL